MRKLYAALFLAAFMVITASAEIFIGTKTFILAPEEQVILHDAFPESKEMQVTDILRTASDTWIAGKMAGTDILGDPVTNKVIYRISGGIARQSLKKTGQDDFHMLTTEQGNVYVYSANQEHIYSQPLIYRLPVNGGSTIEALNLPKFTGFPNGFTCFNGYGESWDNCIKLPVIVLGNQKYMTIDFVSGYFKVTDN